MSEQKHTPLPFVAMEALANKHLGFKAIIHHVNPELHQAPAYATGRTKEECEATAAFIVRACNSHYELVEALQNLMNGIETGAITSDQDEVLENAVAKARAALAKAKGGAA